MCRQLDLVRRVQALRRRLSKAERTPTRHTGERASCRLVHSAPPSSIGEADEFEDRPHERMGAVVDVTGRGEMEEFLRRSNERLRLALSAASLGCWEFDVATRVTEVDQRYREIYGFAPGVTITPEQLLSIISPEDVSLVRAAIEAALDPSGDGLYHAEYRIRRPNDGEERWIASRAQAILEGGRAARLIGVASDISDRKSSERDLLEKAELAEQLACVAASAPGLIASFRLEPNGKATLPYASPNLDHVYGLPAEALRRDAGLVLERIHADDRERVKASIAESARTMSLWRESYRFDHPQKGWIWIEAQSLPTRQQDGSILWHGYLQDVTESKRIENELIEKEARLRATIEGAHDAIVIMDERGAIQSLNSAAKRMFGYRLEEVVGRSLDFLIPCGWSALDRRGAAEPSRGGKKAGVAETEARRKDGASFPVDVAMGEASCQGRPLLIAFVRDLTERRKIDERMRKLHAERLDAMGELATGLAHELNQPLAATSIYLKAARRLLQMPAELRSANVEDALDNASAQIIRAGRIISHLREFIARGEPDKTIQNLHDLIDEANELVIAEAKQANILVVFQLNAKNDRVLADRVQIKQVVVNLMRNAKDAMSGSKRRKMLISTSSIGKTSIKVDVADTGHGLSEETKASLFEPFMTTKVSGLGVGLSISRSIIEAHYGTIWAAPNVDGGATFSFTLPLNEMEGIQ